MARTNGQQVDIVTQKLLQDKFATIPEIEVQTGSKNPALYKGYLASHGLFYGLTNKSGQPEITHLIDSGNSWKFRQKESGLIVADGPVIELFNHDGPEVIAEKVLAPNVPQHTLGAAYVVIDALHHLLSRDAGLDMRYMLGYHTNKAGLVYTPVKKFLSRAAEASGSDVELTDVVAELNRTYAGYRVSPQEIAGFYDGLIARWQRMVISNGHGVAVLDQDKHKQYLSPDDITEIKKAYRQLIEEARDKKSDMMGSGAIEEAVAKEYKRVKTIVSSEEILHFKEPLLKHQNSRMLFRIGQTLYALIYIRDIADEIFAQALKAKKIGYPNLDSYLVLGVGKSLDGRDTASRMLGTPPGTHASIYAKHKGSNIPQFASVSGRLADNGIPNEQLVRAVRFHLNGLKGNVKELEENYTGAVKRNTAYVPHRDLMAFMREDIKDFDPLKGIREIPFNGANGSAGEKAQPIRNLFRFHG